MTGMLARSKLRTNLKKVLCCGCGAAIPLANGLRRRPVNTSLHAISAKNAIRESVVNAIQIPRIGNGVSRSAPMLTKFMLPAGVVAAAASGRLAARDGMNHQDFVLLARDFLDAFTACHVKRLRTQNLGFHVWLLRDVHLRSSVEQQSAGFGSLALILHRFSELSIHNGHSSPYSQKPNGREKSQSWSEYERLAQALLRNCSSVRLQGAANYRALRCADELEAHLKDTVLCDVSTGAGIHMERDG